MDERFLKGIREFNTKDFFDCHDTWEEIWLETRGPDRQFYQGMIQIAVAYYHALNENYSGGFDLFSKGILKLRSYLPSHCGIDLAALHPHLERHRYICAENLHGVNARIDASEIPTLQFQPSISATPHHRSTEDLNGDLHH